MSASNAVSPPSVTIPDYPSHCTTDEQKKHFRRCMEASKNYINEALVAQRLGNHTYAQVMTTQAIRETMRAYGTLVEAPAD